MIAMSNNFLRRLLFLWFLNQKASKASRHCGGIILLFSTSTAPLLITSVPASRNRSLPPSSSSFPAVPSCSPLSPIPTVLSCPHWWKEALLFPCDCSGQWWNPASISRSTCPELQGCPPIQLCHPQKLRWGPYEKSWLLLLLLLPPLSQLEHHFLLPSVRRRILLLRCTGEGRPRPRRKLLLGCQLVGFLETDSLFLSCGREVEPQEEAAAFGGRSPCSWLIVGLRLRRWSTEEPLELVSQREIVCRGERSWSPSECLAIACFNGGILHNVMV